MKRIDLFVLSIVFAVLFSGVVFGADDSSDSSNGGAKARFRWNVTAVIGGVNSPEGCVGQPVRVTVLNYNTHKPVEQTEVRFYLNGTDHIATSTTNSSGTADYSPLKAGNYGIVLVHLGYKDMTFYFSVSSVCGAGNAATTTASSTSMRKPVQTMITINVNESTTSSIFTTTSSVSLTTEPPEAKTTTPSPTTTSSSIPATSTTSVPPTTLAVSTTVSEPDVLSTIPQPTCSDGIDNQGESGVDCGGPCPKCASGGGDAPLLLLVVAVILLIAVYSYLQSRKKPKKALEEDSGHFHKHHRHRKE